MMPRLEIEMVSSRELAQRTWRCDAPIVVMPFTDAHQARRAADVMASRAGVAGLVLAVHDDEREGFIHVANRAFAQSASPFFGYVAQDAFAGRFWLLYALKAFEEPSVHLLGFNDGKWFGRLAAFGLVRRSWASATYAGPLFLPEYRSHYADTELSLIAAEENAFGYAANSVLVEVDWEKDRRATDATDRALFRSRLQTGFDGRVHSKQLLQRFG